MRVALLWGAVATGVWACGGAPENPPDDTGELPSGGTGSGGASSAGGALSGGTSSDGETGGAGGSGAGDPGSGAGGSGSGNDACPPVDPSRLFPITGPFFMGPDPGPCSQSSADRSLAATYSYTGSLVTSSTLGEGENYVRDGLGRITEITSVLGVISSFVYTSEGIIETTTASSNRYELDANGYPVRGVNTFEGAERVWSYVYEDCRLVRRIAPEGWLDRTYSYDDEGHIISYTDGVRVVTFDYSCWN